MYHSDTHERQLLDCYEWVPRQTPHFTRRVALIRYPGSTGNTHSANNVRNCSQISCGDPSKSELYDILPRS